MLILGTCDVSFQVNLEYLGRVVFNTEGLLYPDSVVGTDSHTTMIDGLGVAGWGVGGIEAEAAMLGQVNLLLNFGLFVTWSTGKKPMVAPYSGDMLAIVALSANDNSPIPSPIEEKKP